MSGMSEFKDLWVKYRNSVSISKKNLVDKTMVSFCVRTVCNLVTEAVAF